MCLFGGQCRCALFSEVHINLLTTKMVVNSVAQSPCVMCVQGVIRPLVVHVATVFFAITMTPKRYLVSVEKVLFKSSRAHVAQ